MSGQTEILVAEMSERNSSLNPSSSLPSNVRNHTSKQLLFNDSHFPDPLQQSLPLTANNSENVAIRGDLEMCVIGDGCASGACGEGGAGGDASDGACGEGDPNTEPLSPLSQCASYDKLNPYANPGDLEPVNIISFAYQIASGMVHMCTNAVHYCFV